MGNCQEIYNDLGFGLGLGDYSWHTSWITLVAGSHGATQAPGSGVACGRRFRTVFVRSLSGDGGAVLGRRSGVFASAAGVSQGNGRALEAREAADLPLISARIEERFQTTACTGAGNRGACGRGIGGVVEMLMKQQVIFLRATTALEIRLALQAMGIGKVDIAPFMRLIEQMRADLAQRTAPLAV